MICTGFVTKIVILGAHWLNINPDNVATPVAAALGDCIMVTFVALTATIFYDHIAVTSAQHFSDSLYHFSSQQ